jgi:hypothetical protein
MDYLRHVARFTAGATLTYPLEPFGASSESDLEGKMNELARLEEQGVVILHDRHSRDGKQVSVTVELTDEAREWLKTQWPRECRPMKP